MPRKDKPTRRTVELTVRVRVSCEDVTDAGAASVVAHLLDAGRRLAFDQKALFVADDAPEFNRAIQAMAGFVAVEAVHPRGR